ncbi:Galactoside O-acetyltransferase [compost metagenome]
MIDLIVLDSGVDNFVGSEGVKCSGQNKIEITGDNNKVEISSGVVLKGVVIKISANNSLIRLEAGVRFAGHILVKQGGGNSVVVGENTTVGGARIICSEGTKVTIGKDCMLSSGIEIRSTDSHPIMDLDGKRINYAADVSIGDHVWLAAHVSILKGARIGRNSIIGTRSVVSGSFQQGNEAIAGNPARIVRSGVNWNREHLG